MVKHQRVVHRQPVRGLHTGLLLALLIILVAGQAFALPSEPPLAEHWTAWASYWDTGRVMEEVQALGRRLDAVSLFAAYYDENGQLFLPDALFELRDSLSASGEQPILLTVVNDVLQEEAPALLKDRDILRELFSDDARRKAHAGELVTMALSLQVQGIELDYENLGRDQALWADYAAFIQVMWQQAREAGLALSVVLEPSALGQAHFPEGPQYVVMFYNLNGHHSGPGPKADLDFIRKLARSMLAQLPGSPAAALATGGFVWRGNGEVKSLTEKEARALVRELGAKPERDAASHALHAEGKMDGMDVQIWYADGETLTAWTKAAKNEGIQGFYLWLLGGNEEETLKGLQ